MCAQRHCVYSDKPDGKMNTNGSAVLGTINTGCGYSQLQEFSSTLNIPCMSYNKFRKLEENFQEIFQEECWNSMLQAGQEESFLAKEAGEIDDTGVPVITVVADGSWAKRSYRSNYNSKSGAACIVGQRTGKLLFLGIRNKYCTTCHNGTNKNHLCFKNWNGSSTSMESDIILEGFKQSMTMHGLKYGFLVADGDSSVYS